MVEEEICTQCFRNMNLAVMQSEDNNMSQTQKRWQERETTENAREIGKY